MADRAHDVGITARAVPEHRCHKPKHHRMHLPPTPRASPFSSHARHGRKAGCRSRGGATAPAGRSRERAPVWCTCPESSRRGMRARSSLVGATARSVAAAPVARCSTGKSISVPQPGRATTPRRLEVGGHCQPRWGAQAPILMSQAIRGASGGTDVLSFCIRLPIIAGSPLALSSQERGVGFNLSSCLSEPFLPCLGASPNLSSSSPFPLIWLSSLWLSWVLFS